MRMGRTIAEKRERLETSSERLKAREKVKRKKNVRFSITIVWFVVFLGLFGYFVFCAIDMWNKNDAASNNAAISSYIPTIEIIDEDGEKNNLTSKMNEFIGQMEHDLKDFGYEPLKAIIPSGTVREVRFYIKGYNGYIKTTIDRGAAESAEDIDRMIRYLKNLNKNDFEYVDIRVEERGYWK